MFAEDQAQRPSQVLHKYGLPPGFNMQGLPSIERFPVGNFPSTSDRSYYSRYTDPTLPSLDLGAIFTAAQIRKEQEQVKEEAKPVDLFFVVWPLLCELIRAKSGNERDAQMEIENMWKEISAQDVGTVVRSILPGPDYYLQAVYSAVKTKLDRLPRTFSKLNREEVLEWYNALYYAGIQIYVPSYELDARQDPTNFVPINFPYSTPQNEVMHAQPDLGKDVRFFHYSPKGKSEHEREKEILDKILDLELQVSSLPLYRRDEEGRRDVGKLDIVTLREIVLTFNAANFQNITERVKIEEGIRTAISQDELLEILLAMGAGVISYRDFMNAVHLRERDYFPNKEVAQAWYENARKLEVALFGQEACSLVDELDKVFGPAVVAVNMF